MPVNNYFSPKVSTEQTLFEDIIIESIKMYGQDVFYIPRTIVSRDLIWGEDDGSRFEDAYMVEMYIENIEGFDGEGNLFSKFGLEIRDEATFVVAKRSWQRYVGDWEQEVRPKEGDLVYLPLSNTFFEISFVEHEQPFYQLSNLPVFKLSCRTFEYNGEEFETGINELDALEQNDTYQYILTVNNLSRDLVVGETIAQLKSDGSTITADIMSVTKTDVNTMEVNVGRIASDSGDYDEFIQGDFTTSTGALGTIAIISDTQEFVNDPLAENDSIQEAALNFIDFSESNPFGEP